MATPVLHAPTGGSGSEVRLIVDLADLSAGDLAEAGGKAANLGELIRFGFDVPAGFCVTTAAYRRAVRQTSVAAGSAVDGPAARAAVLAASFPADVAEAVRGAYLSLGSDVAVAVRSSATAEDLPGASFAGQQDTYLNVVGIDDVQGAIHRCWASLWTDRAISYRAAQGVDGAGIALAVVVQRMVDASVAGVLFTADPVTGRRHQAVIDAAPGLGEAVVSGAVDPDHFTVDTDTGTVLERRHGAGAEFCLTNRQVVELAQLGRRVELAFGAPQDIEWALDADSTAFRLTQSRPITTLFPLPRRRKALPDREVRVYFCVSLAQGLHRPITPLGIATFRVLGSAFLGLAGSPPTRTVDGPGGFAVAAERVFVDATPVLRSRIGRHIAPRLLDIMEARSAVVIRRLFDDPRFAVQPGSVRRAAPAMAGVMRRTRLPLTFLLSLASPRLARRRIDRMLDDLHHRPISGTHGTHGMHGTVAERVAGVTAFLAGALPLAPKVLPAAAAGFAALNLAGRLLPPSDREDLQVVRRSLPHNVTTEMDLELWQVAVEAQRDPMSATALRDETPAALVVQHRSGTLPPALQQSITDFLTRYGHRAVAEIDLGLPRWSEDPAHLFGVLAGYLLHQNELRSGGGDETTSPEAHFAAGATAAEEMIERLAGRAREAGRLGRVRAVAVRLLLRRGRDLIGLRETPKFLMITAFGRARHALLEIADDLVLAGALDDRSDVNFLDFDEIIAASTGIAVRDRIALRRATYRAELDRRHIPRVLLSDGTEPEAMNLADFTADHTADPNALTGTPASAGVVTATARVVLDPVDARLQPGEILVAPSTDPGWTPLFLTAGGLVMEMGGSNSHGAVVAREYGIPAVVGVAGATARIVTGMQVTVDGASGVVRLPPAEAGAAQVPAPITPTAPTAPAAPTASTVSA